MKLTTISSIAVALITSVFGMITLLIEKNNVVLATILFSISILSLIVISAIFFLKKSKNQKEVENSLMQKGDINELLILQTKIDFHTIKTKEELMRLISDLLKQNNNRVGDIYADALQEYSIEEKIKLETYIKKTDSYIYFIEIIEDISTETKNDLEIVVDRNGIEKKSVDEFDKYRERKASQYVYNALEVLNKKYSDSICIIPQKTLFQKFGDKLFNEYKKNFKNIIDEIRNIFTNRHKELNELQEKLEKKKKEF
ncbi:MAG: hypothetical protein A2086_03280 [Spirochaetes bacterium GWD1_27_9]|nr:MAG: hypothetical protein A2Z98_12515 [Spirochaetes bacterium GWB1_27_13]OHD45273.1 MAG: hypothetical protein A2086_03280 [Spirochaetes bacterium GWD1_27_9]